MFRPLTLILFLLCCWELFPYVTCISKSNSEAKRDILNQILPRSPNEILIPPGNGSDGPTVVQLFLHVKSIDNLNDREMELTTRLYLRQTWKDLRLQYNNNRSHINTITINDPSVIWTPDIYFSNLLSGHSSDIMRPNTFIKISPDGTVLYSKGVSLTASCPMNLKRFPFDNQACDVLISTYGSTSEDVLLVWKNTTPATILREARTSLFSLEFFSTYTRTASLSTGKYNILVLSFLFRRELGHYLIRIFIPCIMLVILSWISLWINRKWLNVRLLLALASLLTCTVLVYDQNKHRPKIPYSTSMDVFTGVSLTIIFTSIIETIIVHILGDEADKNTKTPISSIEEDGSNGLKKCRKWLKKVSGMGDKIDRWARFIIPLASLFFYSVYFYVASTRDTTSSSVAHENYTVTSGQKI